jgi:hypothetical protein
MERRRARHKLVGAVQHWQRMPDAIARPLSCLQAKQPADVEQARGNRSFDSQPNAIALHLGFRIHEVHCFYLKIVNNVLYGQNHCLLLTKNSQNQPQQAKARTAQKSSHLTEKFRRKAGHFRIKAGKVQFLQMPVFSLILYSKYLTLYCKCLTLALHKI